VTARPLVDGVNTEFVGVEAAGRGPVLGRDADREMDGPKDPALGRLDPIPQVGGVANDRVARVRHEPRLNQVGALEFDSSDEIGD
jgi:hypothetical protein